MNVLPVWSLIYSSSAAADAREYYGHFYSTPVITELAFRSQAICLRSYSHPHAAHTCHRDLYTHLSLALRFTSIVVYVMSAHSFQVCRASPLCSLSLYACDGSERIKHSLSTFLVLVCRSLFDTAVELALLALSLTIFKEMSHHYIRLCMVIEFSTLLDNALRLLQWSLSVLLDRATNTRPEVRIRIWLLHMTVFVSGPKIFNMDVVFVNA